MPDYDNKNSGVLFKNDRKKTPNQPDYTGSAEANHQEFWISAWVREGKKGKYLSLAFTPKESKSNVDEPSEEPTEDLIPF